MGKVCAFYTAVMYGQDMPVRKGSPSLAVNLEEKGETTLQ
jgi:hypothetical protein